MGEGLSVRVFVCVCVEGSVFGRAFIALHVLHLLGRLIALHAARHGLIPSPEFWRRATAYVGLKAASRSDGIICREPNNLGLG